jgi:hypothetical protein
VTDLRAIDLRGNVHRQCDKSIASLIVAHGEVEVPINVFVSVGRALAPAQEAFISSIERHLTQKGLRPRTLGRSEFTHSQPLQFVNKLMDRSGGVLVIALERISIEVGTERPGTPHERLVAHEAIPTPWNQIEAAFAYAKRIPLMVVKENKVRAEGLLEGKYDWYVHSTELDPEFVHTPEFEGTLESWLNDVRQRAGWFRYRN